MADKLTGVLYTYDTHMLYVGALIATARHKHHAGQVFWVPSGVTVGDEHGRAQHVITHLVPPDTFHSHTNAPAAAVLWVDRDDLHWNRAALPDVSDSFFGAVSERLTASLAVADARELARALLDGVAPSHASSAARHPAVKRMCALLDSTAPEHDVTIAQLARQSGLSMRQLRHRFTEELGINPRAYLRWRRLRRAIDAIMHGATLTQAALEGGFADGAHFSRVFQAQFGMSPSQGSASVRFGGPLR